MSWFVLDVKSTKTAAEPELLRGGPTWGQGHAHSGNNQHCFQWNSLHQLLKNLWINNQTIKVPCSPKKGQARCFWKTQIAKPKTKETQQLWSRGHWCWPPMGSVFWMVLWERVSSCHIIGISPCHGHIIFQQRLFFAWNTISLLNYFLGEVVWHRL